MATLSVNGLDEYSASIRRLGDSGERIAKMAVYDGAKVVADAVRAAISRLPSIPNIDALIAYHKKSKTALTDEQKDGLLSGLILTKMEGAGGFISTKLTFVGYNSTKTKKYPQGQPNLMIAASVESGTSARRKQPFFRSSVNQTKTQAEAAMERTADAEIKKIMGG